MWLIQRFSKDDVPEEHHVLTDHTALHVQVSRPPLAFHPPWAGQIEVTLWGGHKVQRIFVEAAAAQVGPVPGENEMGTAVGADIPCVWGNTAPKQSFPQRSPWVWAKMNSLETEWDDSRKQLQNPWVRIKNIFTAGSE